MAKPRMYSPEALFHRGVKEIFKEKETSDFSEQPLYLSIASIIAVMRANRIVWILAMIFKKRY